MVQIVSKRGIVYTASVCCCAVIYHVSDVLTSRLVSFNVVLYSSTFCQFATVFVVVVVAMCLLFKPLNVQT